MASMLLPSASLGRPNPDGVTETGRPVEPVTQYTIVNGARIAYQRFGVDEPALVVSAGSFSHTDAAWEDPGSALFYSRLGSFASVIRYDHLGTSNSDPFPPNWDPSWAGYARELEAVLAACGVERFSFMATLDAGPVALRFAAEHPDRVEKLILFNTAARFLHGDGYPYGMTSEAVGQLLGQFDASWGAATSPVIQASVPSRAGDSRFASWYSKFLRAIGTPTTIMGALQRSLSLDAREWLGAVTQPTLVMHRSGYQFLPIENGRYLAEHIAGARLVELDGSDGPANWEGPDAIIAEIRSFMEATGRLGSPTQKVLTVLFTDIERSTEQLTERGDQDWSVLLRVHNEVAERQIAAGGGQCVKFTGDGVLATFEEPGRALASALRLRSALAGIGVAVRAGLHTGQVNVTDQDIDGLAVHIAARIMANAEPGEVAVSRTLRDLLLGSGVRFSSLGERELKGIDGSWELYRADD